MANEFERIDNPDLTPGAVSTGYQLQNTNIVSQRIGLDCSVVLGGTGQCTLEISGPVDVNGEIYTCNTQVIFTLSTAGKYYIHLAGSGANLTPTIGTGANTFDADKNARYTDTGTYRVLNWVIYYDGTTARTIRLFDPRSSDVLDLENVDVKKITYDSVPVFGFNDDGTPIYSKTILCSIVNGDCTINHGISNARTLHRILSTKMLRYSSSTDQDSSNYNFCTWDDTKIVFTNNESSYSDDGIIFIIYK